ncbi:PAB1 binding protein, variant 2 [Batrachochytrium dendrobatidis]|nr:PAB1 binding protein, variant 2 [Batrachochytrium dendrobatidis]KAK5664883.1 PAB1 binding protein, variant 2 [Batrachochytrium dendrobatidis]
MYSQLNRVLGFSGNSTNHMGSPDRKRSLDSTSDGSNGGNRANRYKRQATDESNTAELSTISLIVSDDEEVTPLAFTEDNARVTTSKPNSGSNGTYNNYNASGNNNHHHGSHGNNYSGNGGQSGRTTAPSDSNAEARESRPIRMRSLISPKEAGVVIGKGGSHVVEIRDTTGSRVTVSGQVPGVFDRVVTVLGAAEANGRAYMMISTKLAGQQHDNQNTDPQSRTVTLRLLVPQSRIGYIIGRQGVRIKEIQEVSGCRVLAQGDPLPNSTERVVTVIGTPSCLEIAVTRICLLVGEVNDKHTDTILYSPQAVAANAAAVYGMGAMGGMQYGGMPHGGHGMGGHANMQHAAAVAQRSMGYANMAAAYGAQAGMQGGQGGVGHQGYYNAMQGMAQQQAANQMAVYGYHQAYGAPNQMQMMASAGYGGGVGASDGVTKVEQITIPDECVGAIIGKGGCKINEVRISSGCQVKIGDPQPGQRRRVITLTGTADAVSKAQFMLLARVEQESQNKDRR